MGKIIETKESSLEKARDDHSKVLDQFTNKIPCVLPKTQEPNDVNDV